MDENHPTLLAQLNEMDRENAALRATLTERDREIERLKAEAGINTARAIHSMCCADHPTIRWDGRDTQECPLCASQAREREAVERAERAEADVEQWKRYEAGAKEHWDIWMKSCLKAESALAAARKALEEIAAIQTDDRDSEESCTMNAIARAALNGDSHA